MKQPSPPEIVNNVVLLHVILNDLKTKQPKTVHLPFQKIMII